MGDAPEPMVPGGAPAFRERRPWRASAEGRWLRRLCAGEEPEDTRVAGLDPALVLHLADVHRLAARAGSRLAARGTDPGSEVERELVRRWRVALGDEAIARDLAEDVGARAAARGIPVLALKAADLARRVYGPGERVGNDVDLLVPPDRLDEAASLLEEIGLVPDHPAPDRARAHWFSTTFRSRERARVQVDLHWRLGPPGRTRWVLPDVLGRAEAVPGSSLRRLAADDLVVYLALHAVAFHGAAGRWLWWLDLKLLWDGGAPVAPGAAAPCGGQVAVATARLRVAELFGGPTGGVPVRARTAAALGRLAEDRGSDRAWRWPVAALAVDRPLALLGVAARVIARGG